MTKMQMKYNHMHLKHILNGYTGAGRQERNGAQVLCELTEIVVLRVRTESTQWPTCMARCSEGLSSYQ